MTEKLVRDLIPAHMIANKTPRRSVREAEAWEIENLLLAKLREEVAEVESAPDSGSLLVEMADVVEVLHALAEHYGWKPEDVELARQTKAATHGRFKFKFVMTEEN